MAHESWQVYGPNIKTWRGLCCMMYLRREGPRTDLGGSLLETKDRKTTINITTLSVCI